MRLNALLATLLISHTTATHLTDPAALAIIPRADSPISTILSSVLSKTSALASITGISSTSASASSIHSSSASHSSSSSSSAAAVSSSAASSSAASKISSTVSSTTAGTTSTGGAVAGQEVQFGAPLAGVAAIIVAVALL